MAHFHSSDLAYLMPPVRLRWKRHKLQFRTPARTSRGVLEERITYIIEAENEYGTGLGECCIMPGLLPEIKETELDFWCELVEKRQSLHPFEAPSPIQFGLESALTAARNAPLARWNTPFARGEDSIPIHHLIWMGNEDKMLQAAEAGVAGGFTCLKLKIGALGWQKEHRLLTTLRNQYPTIEIRVDANGAFGYDEVKPILHDLAELGVSFIEQPLRRGNWEQMAELCRISPTPIALDEELLNHSARAEQASILLDAIQPQAIVIKPSLHGGLLAAENWAACAEQRGIKWWVNSALESNIGLTSLAEWCALRAPGMMQGLGTGRLFTDNLRAPVQLKGTRLYYTPC